MPTENQSFEEAYFSNTDELLTRLNVPESTKVVITTPDGKVNGSPKAIKTLIKRQSQSPLKKFKGRRTSKLHRNSRIAAKLGSVGESEDYRIQYIPLGEIDNNPVTPPSDSDPLHISVFDVEPSYAAIEQASSSVRYVSRRKFAEALGYSTDSSIRGKVENNELLYVLRGVKNTKAFPIWQVVHNRLVHGLSETLASLGFDGKNGNEIDKFMTTRNVELNLMTPYQYLDLHERAGIKDVVAAGKSFLANS